MVSVTFLQPYVLTPRLSLQAAIEASGFGANISACWDAGAADSYSGSGQNWFDLSGNSQTLVRGTDTGSSTDDPTFNGTAGTLSRNEYFSFDGGDYFRMPLGGTWTADLHQDAANFTFIIAVWPPTSASGCGLFGTSGGSLNTGAYLRIDNGSLEFVVSDAGVTELDRRSTGDVPEQTWHVIGLSIDEAANSGFFYVDGAYEQRSGADTWTCAYPSPSALSSTYALNIGAIGNGNSKAPNGARIACAAFLNDALSKAQLDTIYNRMAGRFGLTPV